MKNLTNWKSYWQDSQIEEYNIRNSKTIKLFDVNDMNMEGTHQINYLNHYLGELPMMYYIWKNNIKSDYVVISQYRRDINDIKYDRLDNDEIQFIYHWVDHNPVKDRLLIQDFDGKTINHDPDGFYKTSLTNFIKDKYGLSDEYINEYYNRTDNDNVACIVFASNWYKFCQLCEFIFGYLDYIFPKGQWKSPKKLIEFRDNRYNIYKEKYGEIDGWNFYNDDRYLVFILEIIIRDIANMFFKIFSDGEREYNTNIYTCIDDQYTDERLIGLFYKKNLRINPNSIYILFSDEEKYKRYYHFFIELYNWPHYKIKIVKDKNDIPENAIKLNYDEYIDFEDADDFYRGNYEIKKLNF